MAALAQEQLRVLLLDTKNGVVHIQTVYQSSPLHMPLLQSRVKSRRWAKDFDKCSMCGTTEVQHHGMGLCRRCHRRSMSGHLPFGSWSLTAEQCLKCGLNSSPHKAHGICNRCYMRIRRSFSEN